ncbi:hypothetical protein HPB49_003145 [Dermacentor silvarum]|uniref:Uncharacterized protein n=1 Tax=Dermacentor silvarum TaxID=543639 RepID=A0ACB8DTJ6_DERSI|nr:hypothetical protein HPB49_003145 [Dermacentor silvarum]
MARNDSLGHVEWKKGVVSGAIYTEHDPKLEGLMVSVFERHLRSNPLHSDVFVGVRKMESEVIRWCCKLFHGGPDSCGSMTSGGTESLILACKAHRDYGFFKKGIVYPEMGGTILAHLEPRFVSAEASREVAAKVQAKLGSVSATARKMELTVEGEVLAGTEQAEEFLIVQMTALNALLGKSKCQQCSQPGLSVELGTRHGVVPVTAHAGFDKAGEYLRIKVIHVPVDPQTMKADVRKMKAAITGNTILASAISVRLSLE